MDKIEAERVLRNSADELQWLRQSHNIQSAQLHVFHVMRDMFYGDRHRGFAVDGAAPGGSNADALRDLADQLRAANASEDALAREFADVPGQVQAGPVPLRERRPDLFEADVPERVPGRD